VGEKVENSVLHSGARAFANTPDPAHFFTGARRGALVEAVHACVVDNDTVLAVLGEPGSGKTSVCRRLEQELSANCDVVYLAHPKLNPDALLRAIAAELGIAVTARDDKLDVLHRIQEHALARYAQDQRVVLLVEDAQLMSDESLEELRLLTNLEGSERSLIQTVLFAQPGFAQRLKNAQLRSLDDRIARRFVLGRFSLRDTRQYLQARLATAGSDAPVWTVTATGAVAIYLLSHGRPRRITRLAQGAMDYARSKATTRIGVWEVAHAFLRAREFHAAQVRAPFAYAFLGSLFAAASLASGAWIPPSAAPVAREPAAVVETAATSMPRAEDVGVASEAAPETAAGVEAGTEAEAMTVAEATTSSIDGTAAQARAVSPAAIGVQAAMSSELQIDLRSQHHAARIAGQAWLAGADAGAYTIQLMFCWEDKARQQAARDGLMEALQAVQMADSAFLVTTAIRNRPASMLTFGEFDAKGEALEALAALPAPLHRFRPFVRRIAGLQKEVFGAPVKTMQTTQEALP